MRWDRPRSAQSRRSSRSRIRTLGSSATAASTSRGTAMSTISSGRDDRSQPLARKSTVTIGSPAPVHVSTRSATPMAAPSRSNPIATPPTRSASSAPRSAVRLATRISPAPARCNATATPSPIVPAPTTSTRRPSRPPSRSTAISTAAWLTDAVPRPIPVSVRARLPTPSAWRNSRLRLRAGAAFATARSPMPGGPGRGSRSRR